MSEFPTQPNPGQYEPTVDELRSGLVLNPDETVVFDITPTPNSASRGYPAGNGTEITGKAVAEIRIGGNTTYASGIVINTFDAPGRRDNVLVLQSQTPDSQPTFVNMKLERGQMWGIGKSFTGQESLPDTVSGDHCAIGLDENGRLIIENHNPTNTTAVRKFL